MYAVRARSVSSLRCAIGPKCRLLACPFGAKVCKFACVAIAATRILSVRAINARASVIIIWKIVKVVQRVSAKEVRRVCRDFGFTHPVSYVRYVCEYEIAAFA